MEEKNLVLNNFKNNFETNNSNTTDSVNTNDSERIINNSKKLNKKNKKIKLLTYNIFMRPYGIKTNKSDFKDSRLKNISKIINNYDIICFQEIFETFTHRHQQLIEKAENAGFKYFTHGKSPSFFSPYLIDSGLLIISKYPIVFSK